jgi:hypothetical protein
VTTRLAATAVNRAKSAIWLRPNILGPRVGAEFRIDGCGVDRVNDA